MKFAILVNEGPYQHQASDSAYHFACAALASGHEVIRVFFYHDAVHNGSRLAAPPQDEQSIGALWATLAAEHRLDLVVCVAAAQRRGILDAEQSARLEKDADNLAAGFRIGGLGQLIETGVQADRMVVFGD